MWDQIVRYILSTFLFILLFSPAPAQKKGVVEIEKAIAEKNIGKADSLLNDIIDSYEAQKNTDSLVYYIYYVGRITFEKSGKKNAAEKTRLFLERIKNLSSNPATIQQAYIETGELYGSLELYDLAYQCNEHALKSTFLIPLYTGSEAAQIENNLSTYSQRLGDLSLSQTHSRNALRFLLSDPKPDHETLYITYNGMGSAMWYASKPDSALFFYNKALQTLEKTSRNPVNQFYRPAIILNNLSGLYQLQGQTTKAMAALKTTIVYLQEFQKSDAPNAKKMSAVSFMFEAMDNLAGMYKELGDMRTSKEMLEFSYQQKQANLSPDNPAIFISKILLGQLYFATHDYEKSILFLNDGLKKISTSGSDYSFWQADAYNTLALLYDAKKEYTKAEYYYEKADSLYHESLQGEFDNIYLEFLGNAALHYAEQGKTKIAVATARKGYNYVVKTQGTETLLAFQQLLNLSEVFYLTGNYRKALSYSEQGSETLNKVLQTGNNLLDSVRMELKKPKIVLAKAKAEYRLLPKKNIEGLKPILKRLDDALSSLERRKSVLTENEDIELVMTEHAELLEFSKKINYELYKLTDDKKYLDRLMGLHESGLYNRIRSRLDKNDSIQFANVPGQIQDRGRQLKLAISATLKSDIDPDEKMLKYIKAVETWNAYLEELRINYPDYYVMRYASFFKNTDYIQQAIPENTSLIRYLFIDKKLFALVADNNSKQIFSLETDSLEAYISILSRQGLDLERTSETLYALYRQLWLPLSENIRYKRVIIIPDGILFNLSFEILTPNKITDFKELATKSILAQTIVSYQYSLLLIGKKSDLSPPKDNFVAFAPGFFDELKDNYSASIQDSIEIDRGYFHLLPQPFTIDLAKKIAEQLGGTAFLSDQSNEFTFKKNAGNHKIIHIGTHGEANNDYPEFSRLIFAKNPSGNEEDNSLFVDEIYNINLTSMLTTLSACETGKPGFQEGVGMISLAHAFNYAGSKSILTGLWEVDEQASAILLEDFYNNLMKGLAKDEALRQAKLSYLNKTNGRIIAPQYWAGLVIMGDISPIVLAPKHNFYFLLIPGVLLLLAIGFLFLKKKRIGLKYRFTFFDFQW